MKREFEIKKVKSILNSLIDKSSLKVGLNNVKIQSIWKKIMLQYFLIQYFVTIKNYNSKKTSILECDIGEKLLNSKKKPNLVNEIRKDIKIIWKFINSKLNFTDRDKKKLVIEEYEPDEILLKPYNYSKGVAYLPTGLISYGKRKRKRKKRKKKK